jgi:IclR family transcriptional regulator, acetate operon repressor
MRSVRTALQVFEGVARHQPIGLSQLARELGLPKATVQRSLAALADAGWLVQDLLDPGRWTVATRVALLAEAAPPAQALRAVVRPHLAALRDTTGETVGLFTIDGDHMVLLDMLDGTHVVRAVERGDTNALPVHVSAAGRAMLAALEPRERRLAIERLSAGGLTPYTEQSPIDAVALQARVDDAAAVGYAVVDGEYLDDVCGVGAAVVAPDGRPLAGIAVLAPAFRVREQLAEFGVQVAASARVASAAIGSSPSAQSPGA